MADDRVYEDLAAALDALPNAFPRTPSGAELRLLEALISPDEAWLAAHLRGEQEPVGVIAARAGLPAGEARERLKELARRGVARSDVRDGKRTFLLAPFVVGIYEASLDRLDRELADLFEKYWADGGAAGIMRPQPALHRVVPAQGSAPTEWILPYDDVRAILLANASFHVRDCICRVERGLLGEACCAPVRNCLVYPEQSGSADSPLD